MENKTNGTGSLYGNPTIQGQILSKLRSEAKRLKQTEFPFEAPVDAETLNRIYEWFEERDANQGLLATIGSWGDTLDAKTVLEYLASLRCAILCGPCGHKRWRSLHNFCWWRAQQSSRQWLRRFSWA